MTDAVDPKVMNTPPEVREREQKLKELLMSNDALPPVEDMSDNEIDIALQEFESKREELHDPPVRGIPMESKKDPLEMFSEVLRSNGDKKSVHIHTSIGTIVLRALHVCINQHSVGLILSKDDTNIQPEFGSELEMTIDGRNFTVIYGGGFFTFNRIPVTFLSFFRVSNNTEEQEEQENLIL